MCGVGRGLSVALTGRMPGPPEAFEPQALRKVIRTMRFSQRKNFILYLSVHGTYYGTIP
jgi:hypothetical protein